MMMASTGQLFLHLIPSFHSSFSSRNDGGVRRMFHHVVHFIMSCFGVVDGSVRVVMLRTVDGMLLSQTAMHVNRAPINQHIVFGG